MDLVIYTGATDLSQAAVTSPTDLTPAPELGQLVLGDTEPLTLRFTTGPAGASPAWLGQSGYLLSVTFGVPTANGGGIFAATSDFTFSAPAYSGNLYLGSSLLASFFAGLLPRRAAWLTLQVRLTNPAGHTETLLAAGISCSQSVPSPDTPADTPVNYATYAEVLAALAAAEAAAQSAALDAQATAADRVQTGLDAQATAADRVQTGLDRTAAEAAANAAALDAQSTAADRVATGLDAQATAADRVQTGLDAQATAADRVQTGLDAQSTAADRVQTGLDRTAASASASAALASQNSAATSANAAAVSAAAALNVILNQFKGGVAGNAVPATISGGIAGDYYQITSDGTSQSIAWVTGDIARWNGTSGSWTRVPGGTVTEARVAAGEVLRLPLSGLHPTAATGTVIGTIANGAAQFGTADFGLRARVTRLATATANPLIRTHASGNNRVELRTTTGNALLLRFVDSGGTPTDYTFPSYVLPLGRPVDLIIAATRTGSAALYATTDDNGVSSASISIAASAAVDIGIGNTTVADVTVAFSGTIASVDLLNFAPTSAEALTLTRYGWGALPQHIHAGGAGVLLNLTNAVNGTGGRAYSTFGSASTTGFSAAQSGGGGGTVSTAGFDLGTLSENKVIRLAGTLTVNSGATPGIRLTSTTAAAEGGIGTATIAAGNFSATITPATGAGRYAMFGLAQISATDFSISNFSAVTVGLCGRWVFDGTGAGYQERDRSGGRRPLLLTTTGAQRLKSGDRIQVTATVAHGGAGNLQLTGQAVLPDIGWRLVAITAKSDANVTIQLGNASGGAQVVGSVALTSGTPAPLTIAQPKPTTVNVWSNAGGAANIQYSLVYERDDIT
jgi:hypothetical protein